MKKEIKNYIEAISPEKKSKEEREQGFEKLKNISATKPEILLEYAPQLLEFLDSDNSFSKYAALYLLRDLILYNDKLIFEKNTNVFYKQLTFNKPMIIMHTALVLGEIAKEYSEYAEQITRELLDLEKNEKIPQRELVMGYIIESFEEYSNVYSNKDEMLEFAKRQKESESPKTKKLAKSFLETL